MDCVESLSKLFVIFSHLKKNNFIYLFIFGCAGSLWLCRLFSCCGKQGLLFSCGARASPLVASLVMERGL